MSSRGKVEAAAAALGIKPLSSPVLPPVLRKIDVSLSLLGRVRKTAAYRELWQIRQQGEITRAGYRTRLHQLMRQIEAEELAASQGIS